MLLKNRKACRGSGGIILIMFLKRFTVLVILGLAILSGCQQVRPWERGLLARPDMAWDSDPLEALLQDHIFFSKEASSGGDTAAGGGCGCN